MQSDVQELREILDEWATISAQMIDLLQETRSAQPARNWQPHAAQIIKAVRAFGESCRSEARDFTAWRADGLEPDDIFALVRDQGQRLVNWLQRIMAE